MTDRKCDRAQEFTAAQALLRQLVAHYTAPPTRSAAAASAALESLGTAALLARDWPGAARALCESLELHAALMREQPGRPAADAEVAKVHFLLGIVYRELGQQHKARLLTPSHNFPCILGV